MNIIIRIQNLPIDLIYSVSNFYPRILFILPKEQLVKFDWFRLIRDNFGLIYSKNECTNEEIMKVYMGRCLIKKSNIFVTTYTSSLLINGRLLRCGDNSNGGLGMGDYRNRSVFEELVMFGDNVVEIKGTSLYSFIRLRDGTVMSCGSNNYGQLGHGDYGERNKFTKVEGVGKDIIEIICRAIYTIIWLGDGTLMICGFFPYRIFGYGRTTNVFEEIKGIRKNVEKVVCSDDYMIIKFKDGKLMGCGVNNLGQLGLGDFEDRREFCEIKGIGGNIADVVCGNYLSVVRLTDGTLMSCGFNARGQLGHGDRENRNVFTKINNIGKNIVEVHCTELYIIIRLTDGTLMTSNDDPPCIKMIFYEIKGIPKNISELFCSSLGVVVRLTDGTLIRLGTTFYECLSLVSSVNKNAYDQIKGNIVEVAWSISHTIIRFVDGTIMACGMNGCGQLGINHTKNIDMFEVVKKYGSLEKKKIVVWQKSYLMAGIMIFGAIIGMKVKQR
ncbi:MAG: chromosome condensation regulator [Harvfovirus sp.]|uniref:Chromosome condensation regulator n=1 Tax=Harvfovirus sp. TaxID=2487768 RepID=A0A3G5A238_9VIRU|nr:MAG: chromosome condensation regulator [Harvfovirus sp.]